MSMKSWYKTEYQVYIYNYCSINLLCHDFWYIRICSCMFVWIWHHPGLFPYLIQLCSQLCAATANILHSICYWPNNNWASLVAQTVKNLPAMQETQVQSLGQEDPLEKGMANHSNILTWRIPWTEESGGVYSPWRRKESDTTERLTLSPFNSLCKIARKLHKQFEGAHLIM